MIYPITMYAGKCDGCGKQWDNGDGVIAYQEESTVKESMQDSFWHIEGDKHYCGNCWSYDDDDNIVLGKIN
jgi:hypothetical protein